MNHAFSHLDDLGAWTIAVLGGLAAIGTAIRWLYRRIRHVVKWAQEVATQLERVGASAASADYHSRPNHGDSSYDKLMQEVRGIGRRLDKHIEQAASIHEEQAAAIAHLAGLPSDEV